MRMHIEFDDGLMAEVDQLAGPRGRSGFVRAAVTQAVQAERRWRAIEASAGTIPDDGHMWDVDAAGWVRDQRRTDTRRAG